MKTSSDKMLSELNEMDAAQLLLLGICQQIGRGMGKLEKYRELLADELDTCGGNTEYLDRICENFEKIHKLSLSAAKHVMSSNGGGEVLRLNAVLSGVAERIFIDSGVTNSVHVDIPVNLLIRGEVFVLQKMLLGMLKALGGCAHPYEVKAMSVKVDENDVKAKPWSDASFGFDNTCRQYVEMAIVPAGSAIPELRELLPFAGLDDGEHDSDMAILGKARWIGEAQYNGALLFSAPENANGKGVVLFFPACNDALEQVCDNVFGTTSMNTSANADKTILLVDDEDMIWDVISDMLQTLGYQVILASDGQEAVDICAANPGKIDLVILDMLMPNMGGREAFFLLKHVDPNVKVLISSGYVSQEEIQDVMDAGAAGFLRKPYRMAELDRKIREILSKSLNP